MEEFGYDDLIRDYNSLDASLHGPTPVGVGIEFQLDLNGALVVKKIDSEGPAKRYIGALLEGDFLVAIDSRNMIGATPEQAHRASLGPSGSTVTLHFKRKLSGTPFQITVSRGNVGFHRSDEFNDSFVHRTTYSRDTDNKFRPWTTPYGSVLRWQLEHDYPNAPWASSYLYGFHYPTEKSQVPNLGRIDRFGAPFETASTEPKSYREQQKQVSVDGFSNPISHIRAAYATIPRPNVPQLVEGDYYPSNTYRSAVTSPIGSKQYHHITRIF